MVVDSPLALFTTLFGWQFYNAIWFTLLGTGLALLPFLGVLIEAFITSREEGEFIGADPVGIYKKVEARLIMMLLVVGLAAQPSSLTSLTPETITHTPVPTALDPQPVIQTAANSGSTFDDTGFADFEDLDQGGVEVPIWWFSVLSVSSGVNAAVLAGFPEIDSLRDISRLAQATNISDPVVRSETSEFFTQCYLRAKSRFEREHPPGADPIDISWIGSRFFLEEYQINGDGPIIYDFLRARRSIQGFPFNEARDFEWLPEFRPEFGKPTCSQWWLGEATDGREGLRQLLLNQVNLNDDGLDQAVAAAVSDIIGQGFDTTDVEDRLIQGVLTRDPPQLSGSSFGESGFEPGDGYLQQGLRAIQPAITMFGVGMASGFFALFMDVMTQLLPMIQPMLLMGFYALLPFALVISRFSPSFLVSGAFGIFAINFWPVLWHMASWVDDNLLLALFPASFNDGEPPVAFDLLVGLRGVVGTGGETKLMLLNMVTGGLFLLLPTVFTTIISIAGIRVANGIGTLTNTASSNPAAQSASSGPGKITGSFGRATRPTFTANSGKSK